MRTRHAAAVVLLALAARAPMSAFSADSGEEQNARGFENRDAHARISFERLTFPCDEHVGLIGTSYLVDVKGTGGLSVGPAVYGAIAGKRGGFFTFGAEAAWHRRVLGPFGVELGLYAGGGGGSGSPQGGGLMLRPHADLLWEIGSYAVGVSLAKVKFPSGQIDSTQWGLVLNAATDFTFVPAKRLDASAAASRRTGIGFDRVQIIVSNYRTRSRTTLIDGAAQPRDIPTLGVRTEQNIGQNTYWGLEAGGAAQSVVSGYAEYLGTIGFEGEVIRNQLNLGGRLALGMAGGGGIRVGGGLLAKAAVYGVLRASNDVGISIEAGIADAPRGEFRAASVSAAVVWALDGPDGDGVQTRPVRTDFSAGLEQFDAARSDGSSRKLAADVLKVDRFLSPNSYLSGQVHSAISGGAGGYSAALIGAGWLQPLAPRWHVGVELLAGASGGGAVASRGIVFEPVVYAGFQIGPTVAVRIGGGRVKALRGPLKSNVADISLTASYGVSGGS